MVQDKISKKETVLFLIKYLKRINKFLCGTLLFNDDAGYRILGYSEIVNFIIKLCELPLDNQTSDRVYNTLSEYFDGRKTREEVYKLFKV